MNRRKFLQSGIATFGACAAPTSFASGLKLVSTGASSSKTVADYKTLVCINVQGGADSISLFVPTANSDYTQYQKIRQNLAYEQTSINGISPVNNDISFEILFFLLKVKSFFGNFSKLYPKIG